MTRKGNMKKIVIFDLDGTLALIDKRRKISIDDKGKMEIQLRVLGNELVAIKMSVDDFKMKWLLIGVISIVALGWAAGSFGPELVNMFGE